MSMLASNLTHFLNTFCASLLSWLVGKFLQKAFLNAHTFPEALRHLPLPALARNISQFCDWVDNTAVLNEAPPPTALSSYSHDVVSSLLAMPLLSTLSCSLVCFCSDVSQKG